MAIILFMANFLPIVLAPNRMKGALTRTNKIPKGSILIVEELDRLSREVPRIAISEIWKLVDKGIEIHVLSENLIINNDNIDNLDVLLTLLIKYSRANDESKIKSVRVKDARRRKRKNIY